MILEHHDANLNDAEHGESGPTHCANAAVDYDYQAEMLVSEDAASPNLTFVVKWVLRDTSGVRAVWTRRKEGPVLIAKAHRFGGEWVPIKGFQVIPDGFSDSMAIGSVESEASIARSWS